MSKMEVDSTQAASIESDLVIAKYKAAAEIANSAMAFVVPLCVAGASVHTLIKETNAFISEKINSSYKGKDVYKGFAVPTTICINDCVSSFAPLDNEEPRLLSSNDVVKIDLGAQIDGYPAVLAHTLVVPSSSSSSSSSSSTSALPSRSADVVVAAHLAAEAAIRQFGIGQTNGSVARVIGRVAEVFGVAVVEGVVSHNVVRGDLAGRRVVLNKSDVEMKVDEFVFENNEVYHVDVVFSTGEGKTKEKESRTTVFKRTDENYHLKMKSAKSLLHEVTHRFGKFPFALGLIEEKGARLGLSECLSHDILQPLPVLYERQAGAVVAQFKYTIFVTSKGIERITHHPLAPLTSSIELKDEEIKTLLETPLKTKKKRGKDEMETN